MIAVMEHITFKNNLSNNKLNEYKNLVKNIHHSVNSCLRYDLINDINQQNIFATCIIYENKKKYDEFDNSQLNINLKKIINSSIDKYKISKCKLIYPNKIRKIKYIEEDIYYTKGLYIIHAPLMVNKDKYDKFIYESINDSVGSTKYEQGCLRFDLYQNIENLDEFYLYEIYVNEECFKYHGNTKHFAKWIKNVPKYFKNGYRLENCKEIVKGTNIWPPDNYKWE